MRNQRQLACLAILFGALSSAADEADVIAELQERLRSDPVSSLLFFSQEERRVTFKSAELLYPTREIKAGSAPSELGDRPADLSALTYELDDNAYLMTDFLQMPYNKGFIVVQKGDVLFERYAPGNDGSTRWISFSVAKSVTSMLIGAALKDGFIASVEEPIAHYLPRLRGTPYETSTIKDVLQMSSGVSWNEDYADPDSDVAKAGAANGMDLVNYLSKLPRQAEPGEVFNYNSAETNLVGEVLRSAIGNNASTYLSHKIWQPFGMESDASWMTSGIGGGETGGCCINATLRDYARIGIFAMKGGLLEDGTPVLPENWMSESIAPSKGYKGYGYLWWPHGDGSYSALGIFEQQIYINPSQQLVISVHSNAPTAVGSDYGRHLEQLIPAIVDYLD